MVEELFAASESGRSHHDRLLDASRACLEGTRWTTHRIGEELTAVHGTIERSTECVNRSRACLERSEQMLARCKPWLALHFSQAYEDGGTGSMHMGAHRGLAPLDLA